MSRYFQNERTKTSIPWLTAALLFASITGAARASDLNVGGDAYLKKMTEAVAKSWKKPGLKINEVPDGAGDSMKALLDGKLHVVRIGREPESFEVTESGGKLVSVPVAQDGIAIIVNTARFAAMQKMVKGQLRDVFFYGKYKDWSKIRPELKGPIHVYGLDPDTSSIAQTFHRLLLGNSHIKQLPEAIIQPDVDHVVSAVAADDDGVGYVPIDALNTKVHSLEIGDDWAFLADPTPFHITQGQYLLTRKAYLVYLKDNADAKAFVDFAASAAGQDAIVRAGFLPFSK